MQLQKRKYLKNKTDGIFWDETQKAVEGTGIELSEIYIDNMAQQMVIATEQFNGSVLVSTNLFYGYYFQSFASALVGFNWINLFCKYWKQLCNVLKQHMEVHHNLQDKIK